MGAVLAVTRTWMGRGAPAASAGTTRTAGSTTTERAGSTATGRVTDPYGRRGTGAARGVVRTTVVP